MSNEASRGVLVTGASRGIGRATAIAFAERGDRVAVHFATGRQDAERTRALLPGTGHVLVCGDLGETEAPPRVLADAVERLGTVDVLVNNAALAPSPETEHPVATSEYAHWTEVWRRMIDVDLLSAVNLTWALVDHLIGREASGAIVNVGSRGAFRGEPLFPAYGAAKAALHAFGQSMAVALAPHGIRVASVAPGFVATDRQRWALEGEGGDSVREQSPFGRVGTPEEIASAIVYLASPDATWSSGAVLDINGASYLRN